LGAILLSSVIVSLLLGLIWIGDSHSWNSSIALGLILFPIISLIIFFFIEEKVKDPILPLSF